MPVFYKYQHYNQYSTSTMTVLSTDLRVFPRLGGCWPSEPAIHLTVRLGLGISGVGALHHAPPSAKTFHTRVRSCFRTHLLSNFSRSHRELFVILTSSPWSQDWLQQLWSCTHRHNTTQSVVTAQTPITLELKNTSGKSKAKLSRGTIVNTSN
ncbi:unnamed protein product [Laminaria digitata]